MRPGTCILFTSLDGGQATLQHLIANEKYCCSHDHDDVMSWPQAVDAFNTNRPSNSTSFAAMASHLAEHATHLNSFCICTGESSGLRGHDRNMHADPVWSWPCIPRV